VGDAARDRAFELIGGFRASSLVRTAALLPVPDALAEGPASAGELAAKTGALADPLGRVLRGLATVGVVEELPDHRFRLTAVGDCLRDRPGSLRALAIMQPAESQAAFMHLEHTLQTGEPAYARAHGVSRWDHLAAEPDLSRAFNDAMVGWSQRVAPVLARSFDFDAARVVVDVGGGAGALLSGILAAHPHCEGVDFDLPAGLRDARPLLEAAGIWDRCRLVEGSFFEAVPAGGDVYLLKQILHDWSDADCIRILERCRDVVDKKARLLVVERLLPDIATPADLRVVMGDLQMMVVLGGRERTVEQYRQLLSMTRFSLNDVTPLIEDFSLLVVRPAD